MNLQCPQNERSCKDPRLYLYERGTTLTNSYRQKRAQQPPFPSGICDATFDRAEEYVTSLLHDGGAYPVALSCDDTALLGAYRVMLDNTTDSWFLVGAVGNPIPIDGPEEVTRLMEEGNLEKACKVSFYYFCPHLFMHNMISLPRQTASIILPSDWNTRYRSSVPRCFGN
jgi:hypothetical protein